MPLLKSSNSRNKNQGLELMLDKIVKALFRQHKHPMKIGRGRAALGVVV